MVSHRSFSSRLIHKTDLFTGALSYENKFSLDAKPISGGVRFLTISLDLVFVERGRSSLRCSSFIRSRIFIGEIEIERFLRFSLKP